MPIIPIAAAVVGGAIASRGASKAAQTQANAADRASDASLQAQREFNALQERMFNLQRTDTNRFYDQARADQTPFRNLGVDSGQRLRTLLGLERAPAGSPEYSGPSDLSVNDSADRGWMESPPGRAFLQTLKVQPDNPLYRAPVNTSDPEYGSLNKEFRLKDFSMEDFKKDPGYDFRMNEGREALEGSAAARGNLLSGATLKALQRYGQDYASNEYGNAYDRFNRDQERKYNAFENNRTSTFNRLSTLMGGGQTATNQINSVGNQALNANNNAARNYSNFVGNNNMNIATNVGNNMMSAGNARASGYVGRANAWNDAFGNLANFYNQNRLLNQSPRYSQPSAIDRIWGA